MKQNNQQADQWDLNESMMLQGSQAMRKMAHQPEDAGSNSMLANIHPAEVS